MKLKKELKEKLSVITCLGAFISGFALTYCGFWVSPVGVIDPTVLTVLSQCLIYCGCIIGIDIKLKDMKEKIDEHFNDKEKK